MAADVVSPMRRRQLKNKKTGLAGENLDPGNVDAGLSRIGDLLTESEKPSEFDHLKTRCTELADTAFELIRWQTSPIL